MQVIPGARSPGSADWSHRSQQHGQEEGEGDDHQVGHDDDGDGDNDDDDDDVRSVKVDEKDYDTEFQLPSTTWIGGKEKSLPLREIINR